MVKLKKMKGHLTVAIIHLIPDVELTHMYEYLYVLSINIIE